jgi:hypothetical protein
MEKRWTNSNIINPVSYEMTHGKSRRNGEYAYEWKTSDSSELREGIESNLSIGLGYDGIDPESGSYVISYYNMRMSVHIFE